LYNAFQQLLSAFQNYGGISQWDPEIWSQLSPDQTLFPQFPNRFYPIASEAIGLGAPINLHSNAGVINCRNANATDTTKPAHGYVTAAIANGVRGEVILGHGLVIATGAFAIDKLLAEYCEWTICSSSSVAAGNIEQFLGVGISANALFFQL